MGATVGSRRQRRALVAGVDSSTRSCKVVVREAESGRVVRSGRAAHHAGTSVDPELWWTALDAALREAGGLDGVAAISVAAQQHGMICLDGSGDVVRDALLWNDTRSAGAAEALLGELPGGPTAWAEATGSVPVASFTVTKLRWMAEHEPGNAARTDTVCLPHDWLTWRLLEREDRLVTDRSDASGTGYWSPGSGTWRHDLVELAFSRRVNLPDIVAPHETSGVTPAGVLLGPGAGDNAAAALGVDAKPGDVVVSVGTSGVASSYSPTPTADPSGAVAGFADATGGFLPLCCTLNGVGVLEATARMIAVTPTALSSLALQAEPGAGGVVVVPYFEGERTPNRPNATAAVHGLDGSNSTQANLARAAFEGLLCGLADGVDQLCLHGVKPRRVLLVGGGANSEALRRIAPSIFGLPVVVPEPGEYVADGAARQAAWVLSGEQAPPAWPEPPARTYDAPPQPGIRQRYASVRDLVASRC